MTASVMMTLRVDPQLKRALERRARAQGRSVSAELVRLIRREVEVRPPPGRRRTGFGMFSRFDSLEVMDVRALRRSLAARWLAHGRARHRRRA